MLKTAVSILFSASLLILSSFSSCKTKASTSKSKNMKSDAVKFETYSLVITFFSIGTGVDYKTKKIFDEWTINFEQKIGKKIKLESYPWGREGEVDVCISMENLSTEQKKEFTTEAKKIISASKLARLEENVICKRKT